MAEMPDWQRSLSADDRDTIARGRWARRVGFGVRPAVILIDVQNHMVGEEGNHDLAAYPYSCASGWAAVCRQTKRIAAARAAAAPVIYTRFAIDRTVGDAGLFDTKIGAEAGENVYFEGTHGSEIAPEPGDLVFTKKKPSSFHGTPLLPCLIDRSIDTLIVPAAPPATASAPQCSMHSPTTIAPSYRRTRCSTACRSATRSTSST